MIKLTVGQEQQLGVIVKDFYGNIIDIPSTVNWEFSNEFATVDSNGLLKAGTIVGVGDVTATLVDSDISCSESVEIKAGPAVSIEIIMKLVAINENMAIR